MHVHLQAASNEITEAMPNLARAPKGANCMFSAAHLSAQTGEPKKETSCGAADMTTGRHMEDIKSKKERPSLFDAVLNSLTAPGFYWVLVVSEFMPPLWLWLPPLATVEDLKAS